jgi:membrane protein
MAKTLETIVGVGGITGSATAAGKNSMAAELTHIHEPGGTEVATAAGGAQRYHRPLKSVRWRDLKALLAESFGAWSKHKAPRLGASLAFYTLLSLAPLLLILISVVGLVLGHQAAEKDVVAQIQALVGSQGAKAAEALIEGSQNTTHGIMATVFGLLTLLFGASGVMIELRDALNTIWEVPTPELSGFKMISSFVKERLFSFTLVLAIGFILVVSLALSAWIAALGAWSASILPAHEAILHILNFVVSFAIITGLFSAIYRFLPDVRMEWRDVMLGGAVTSLLFTLGKLALGIYLGKASFASTYGAAASIVILIVWVYYSAQIFFLGAEFTKTFANCYGSQPSRQPADNVGSGKPEPGAPHIITPLEVHSGRPSDISDSRNQDRKT